MSNDITTTGPNAVSTLSQDEQSLLEADRQRMGGSLPSIPQIRLSNKDMKQAPEGEYFIEVYKGKDEEPEIRCLGPNPEITIVYKTNTYSSFTKEKGCVAWTSDIHGFGPLDTVTLFRKIDGKVVIDFDGPYPEFKEYKKKFVSEDRITGDRKNSLKFKTVLYVVFEGKPYKIFVSNASSAGVDAEGNPSFDEPKERSLQRFTDACWQGKRAMYEFTVRLGSQYVESSKRFYIMTFEGVGETVPESLPSVIKARHGAEKAIYMIDDARRKPKNDDIEELPEIAPVEYASEIKAEDLPF